MPKQTPAPATRTFTVYDSLLLARPVQVEIPTSCPHCKAKLEEDSAIAMRVLAEGLVEGTLEDEGEGMDGGTDLNGTCYTTQIVTSCCYEVLAEGARRAASVPLEPSEKVMLEATCVLASGPLQAWESWRARVKGKKATVAILLEGEWRVLHRATWTGAELQSSTMADEVREALSRALLAEAALTALRR